MPTSALCGAAADSQQDAERLIDNQIPATSDLVATALDRGAFAASSFGAGFGGSVWALVDRASARTFANDWDSAAFLANPGPPSPCSRSSADRHGNRHSLRTRSIRPPRHALLHLSEIAAPKSNKNKRMGV